MENQPLLKSVDVDSRVLTPAGPRGDGRKVYGTSSDAHRKGDSSDGSDVMVNHHRSSVRGVCGGECYEKSVDKSDGSDHQRSDNGDEKEIHQRPRARGHSELQTTHKVSEGSEVATSRPDLSEKGTNKDVGGDCSDEPEEKVVVSWKEQRKRLVLLTLIGFLAACAGRIYTPLITQYTYQVYTERLFGNLSDGMDVSKEPCVINTSSSSTLAQQVQDQSSVFLARAEMIDGGVSIVVNLFLGSYSDFVGRRLALLLPVSGHFLRIAALSVVIHWDLGLPGVYVGYLLDGLCGGFAGLTMALYSYSADITRAGSQRTVGTTLVGGSINLGQAALNILAGLFIQDTGFFYPALAATILQLFCLLLILLLPETVSRDRKRLISPVKAVWRVVGTFAPPGDRYKQAFLLLALLAFFINTLTMIGGLLAVQPLYLMDQPFCWSSFSQGIWGSAYYTSGQLAAFLMVKVLHNAVSAPLLAIMGLLSDIGRNVLMALARNDLQMYMVIPVGICKELIYPAMRSFMSSLVPRHRQGAVFAGIAIIESVCQCLGPITMSAIYTATLSFMAGFAFLSMAGSQLWVICIFLIIYCLHRKYVKRHVRAFDVQFPDTQTDDVHGQCAPQTEHSAANRRASV